MEIRNLAAPGTRAPALDQHQEQAKTRATRHESSSGDHVEISADARRAVLAAELARAVVAMDEVRPEVVEAARRAAERGELDTPAAAEATARAIARGV